MSSLTIRKLDDDVKTRLRVRAARNGRSMEEEARVILRRAVDGVSGPALWELSRRLFAGDAGVELGPVSRSADRPAPGFAEDDPPE